MDEKNQNPRSQLVDRLKKANNVLVTVSRNPSVDQLAGAIGLTLLLNKLDKHASAVFSGEVPSALEFLKPEDTLESNTDSLRDFIISLDKAKADKLRYKVEDTMVKIFITPYHTSLSEADLVYSQGDFNVDVVVAIGVHEREELDQAITSHGRILHDATVATLNTQKGSELGTINWVDTKASSLSEMLVGVCEGLKSGALDGQMATALLTGIVAETERFSNDKTTSDTMGASAKLMSAGANQQLVATQLQQPPSSNSPANKIDHEKPEVNEQQPEDGSLAIDHKSKPEQPESASEEQPQPEQQSEDNTQDQASENNPEQPPEDGARPRIMTAPPSMGGTLTASSKGEQLDPATDPMAQQKDIPMLSHQEKNTRGMKVVQPPQQGDDKSDEPFGMKLPQPESHDLPEITHNKRKMIDNNQSTDTQPAGFENQDELVPDMFQAPEDIAKPAADLAQNLPYNQSKSELAPTPPSPSPQQDQTSSTAPDTEPAPKPQQPPESQPQEQSLEDLEKAVDSPHLGIAPAAENKPAEDAQAPDADAALAAAHQAFDEASQGQAPEPTEAEQPAPPQPEASNSEEEFVPSEPQQPEATAPIHIDPNTGQIQYIDRNAESGQVTDPTAPPAVPPPMSMPPLPSSDEQANDPNSLPPLQQ